MKFKRVLYWKSQRAGAPEKVKLENKVGGCI